MPILREDKDSEYYAECSNSYCEYQQEMEFDWLDTVNRMKKEGWLIVKKGITWVHLCPDCKEAGIEAEGCA